MTSPRPTRNSLPLASPDEMYALVYEELKRIARHHLHSAGAKATLSTTELVHEAFLKLGFGPDSGWEGRAHFFGAASRAMRQVLVDFARRRQATKRGGGNHQVPGAKLAITNGSCGILAATSALVLSSEPPSAA